LLPVVPADPIVQSVSLSQKGCLLVSAISSLWIALFIIMESVMVGIVGVWVKSVWSIHQNTELPPGCHARCRCYLAVGNTPTRRHLVELAMALRITNFAQGHSASKIPNCQLLTEKGGFKTQIREEGTGSSFFGHVSDGQLRRRGRAPSAHAY
jgi:hypothetical protein